MKQRPITYAQIMAAKNHPGNSPSPAGWTRDVIEAWGVPWPVPLGWIEKLVAGGVPYQESPR